MLHPGLSVFLSWVKLRFRGEVRCLRNVDHFESPSLTSVIVFSVAAVV